MINEIVWHLRFLFIASEVVLVILVLTAFGNVFDHHERADGLEWSIVTSFRFDDAIINDNHIVGADPADVTQFAQRILKQQLAVAVDVGSVRNDLIECRDGHFPLSRLMGRLHEMFQWK